LFFVLWIMAVVFAFRLLDFILAPTTAIWDLNWGWRAWSHPYGGWHGLEGMLMGIVIIAGLIGMARWRRWEDERGAERRDRDGR
jgi:hypothetical protein